MMGDSQRGFTLVEMLITMAIAMVVLAGMTSVFVSQTRLSNMMNNKTEAMGDLYLASQIMQSELRGAKDICLNGTKKLLYQPLDSTTPLGNGCSDGSGENGKFEYRTDQSNPRVCWDRPNKGDGCQELIRELADTSGMVAVVDGYSGVWTITLLAQYVDKNRQAANLDLAFKVWPRN